MVRLNFTDGGCGQHVHREPDGDQAGLVDKDSLDLDHKPDSREIHQVGGSLDHVPKVQPLIGVEVDPLRKKDRV